MKNLKPFSSVWWQGKSLWLLLPAILVFIVGKWADLSLPFFWDELGVYGRGILHMVDHGPGMLPSSLPPELSRGHPLFFYFFFSLGGWISGFSLPFLHGMALWVTIGLFAAVYFAGKQLMGEWVGLAATLFMMVMPVVFAQATLILPEMMLALLVFLGLYTFFKKRFGWYFILCGLALLTKESAIVLPLATALFSMLTAQNLRIRNTAIALSPLTVFALFLAVQRLQNGWWFFPYHVELVSFAPEEVIDKLGRILRFLFIAQGRWGGMVLLLIGVITFAWNTRKKATTLHPFFLLAGIFFLGWLGFSSLNFYMDRYFLAFFPVTGLFAAAGIREMSRLLEKKEIILAVPFAGVLILPLLNFTTPDFHYDVDISFRRLVNVQIQTTHFLEKEVAEGELFFANFPLYNGFLDNRYGYMQTEGSFRPTVVYHDSLRIIAIIQPPLDAAYTIHIDPAKEIWRYEDGYSKAVVYDLKKDENF
ncbi:MAG: glycosyltransferase family 39 protein [Bacteroidia bacterium]